MAAVMGILKHASNVPACLGNSRRLCTASFPSGVFQTLLVGADKVGDGLRQSVSRNLTVNRRERVWLPLRGNNLKKKTVLNWGSDPFIVLPR